jgi:hypothetical protein
VPCLFRLTHPHLQLFLFELPLRDGPGGSITLVIRGERSRDWDPAPTGLGAGTARIPVDGLLCVPGDGIISIMQGSLFCFIIFLSLFYFQDIAILSPSLADLGRGDDGAAMQEHRPNRSLPRDFRSPTEPIINSSACRQNPYMTRHLRLQTCGPINAPHPSKYPYMP